MLSRAALSETLSPRLQRASPGIASGPKWPWPGMSDRKDLVNGSYRRLGPRKHVALFVDPWLMKSCARVGGAGVSREALGCGQENAARRAWFSAAFMSSP